MTITFRKPILAAIGLYQKLVSPFLPSACRFHPSCSEYAAQAIDRYGIARGSLRAIRRVCRCHPWHAGGFDPLD